jgi:hypothetical protein
MLIAHALMFLVVLSLGLSLVSDQAAAIRNRESTDRILRCAGERP